MEVIGGILASLVAMALLAGIGVMTVVALAVMLVLGLLTEMSFKRLFFVSFGIGLIAPILLGLGIGGAIADGSFERDWRGEVGEVIQLPEDMGDQWREALPQLRDISREVESGQISEQEAERRVEEVLSGLEDFQIKIDVDGDGIVTSDGDAGVPLELPEPVESESDATQ